MKKKKWDIKKVNFFKKKNENLFTLVSNYYPLIILFSQVEAKEGMLSRTQHTGGILKPALELVKSVCKVLELDASIGEEVTRLKRNLLRLIGKLMSCYKITIKVLNYCLSQSLPFNFVSCVFHYFFIFFFFKNEHLFNVILF